jgi:hypothetical protein
MARIWMAAHSPSTLPVPRKIALAVTSAVAAAVAAVVVAGATAAAAVGVNATK